MIAVVFDMDGVLFDTQKIYLKSWIETGVKLEIPNLDKPAFECIGRNRHDQHEILYDFYNGNFDFDEFYKVKDEIFSGHLEKEGVPLMKGTVEILQYLKSINAKVAIASSSSIKSIEHHIQLNKIENYFQKIVGGDLVVHSKPAPDIYLKACELLQVDPVQTYAVEDSYNGVKAAVAAGMKTIMIPDVQPATPEYDAIINKRFDSMLGFLEYLKEGNQ